MRTGGRLGAAVLRIMGVCIRRRSRGTARKWSRTAAGILPAPLCRAGQEAARLAASANSESICRLGAEQSPDLCGERPRARKK